jgi:hypothetical protein
MSLENTEKSPRVGGFVRVVLGLWFVAVLVLGAAGSFVRAPGAPPWPILFGALTPLGVFVAAYETLPSFRRYVLSADLGFISSIQAWRAGGLGFLALYAHGVLPGLFAWPAGLGDIAVGVAAPWIAFALRRDARFSHSKRFLAWNVLGIVDLVTAVSLGALSSGLLKGLTGGVTTAPMAQLPLVLIPAYLVPLFVMLHITTLLQIRRATRAGAAKFEPSPAVHAGQAA